MIKRYIKNYIEAKKREIVLNYLNKMQTRYLVKTKICEENDTVKSHYYKVAVMCAELQVQIISEKYSEKMKFLKK